MAKDDTLFAIGDHLHQDALIGVRDEAELAKNVLACLPSAEQAALRTYLADALQRLSPSELKGKLNRTTRELWFTSKGADAFLRALLAQLDA